MLRPPLAALLLSLLVLLGTLDEAVAEPVEVRARALVREGNRHYKQRDFQEALRHYQQAFTLSPTAITVFNMGQCLRELGQLGPAVYQFRIFLAMAPDAPNVPQVKELIAELERRRKAAGLPGSTSLLPPALPPEAVAIEAPVTSPRPVPEAGVAAAGPSRPWYRRWYVWVPIAAVVAGGAVGGALAATRGAGPALPMTEYGNMSFPFRR